MTKLRYQEESNLLMEDSQYHIAHNPCFITGNKIQKYFLVPHFKVRAR